MPLPAPAHPVEVRHLQLARAGLAALAAAMITFTPDHSASVGLAIFSGWAIATGLVELLAAWLVRRPAGREGTGPRWSLVLLGAVTMLAGMVTGLVSLRSTLLFFVVVTVWALITGAGEFVMSWRAVVAERRTGGRVDSETRDGIVVGAVTVLLGLGLVAVPTGYRLDYLIPAAGQSFTLTGIAIAVGVFGGYAAIVAVYLGIAGLSPRRVAAPVESAASATAPSAGATADAAERSA